jgi:hypothetical protein
MLLVSEPHTALLQLELQRQQLLSDRQQFQRDQLKAAEVRSLQSPTLQPQTPIQLPAPILRAPPMRSPSALKPPPASLALPVPEGEKMENQQKIESQQKPMESELCMD